MSEVACDAGFVCNSVCTNMCNFGWELHYSVFIRAVCNGLLGQDKFEIIIHILSLNCYSFCLYPMISRANLFTSRTIFSLDSQFLSMDFGYWSLSVL